MIITLRRSYGLGDLASSIQHTFTFDLCSKSSTDNTAVLLSSGFLVDIDRETEEKIQDFNLQNFRSALASAVNLNENDRLFYIDNDNDEIPIDQQSEFLEALKFAEINFHNPGENVKLIVVKAKNKDEKSLNKLIINHPQLSEKPSISMRVESKPVVEADSTVASVVTTAAGPATDNSEQDALKWFRDFLENYKKEMIADVTNEVMHRITSAMLLSQNMNSVKTPSPTSSSSVEFLGHLQDNAEKSTSMMNDPSCMEKINTLYRARGHGELSNNVSKTKVNNHQANEKSKSDSDNISIVSDKSYMSKFVIDDENYEFVDPEEVSTIGNEGSRPNSTSSFELVPESLSPTNSNDQQSLPKKNCHKPIMSSPLGAVGASTATSVNNVSNPTYGFDTQGKVYKKNMISNLPEKTVIDPILEKRSGGAYSFISQNLPNHKEKVSNADFLIHFKALGKKQSIGEVVHPETGEFYHSMTDLDGQQTTSSEKKIDDSKEPEIDIQSPHRVFIDHNASKGLGDTKRTCPMTQSTTNNDPRPHNSFTQNSQYEQSHGYPKYNPFTHNPYAELGQGSGRLFSSQDRTSHKSESHTSQQFAYWPHAAYCHANQLQRVENNLPGHTGHPAKQEWNLGGCPYSGFSSYSTDPMQILPETLISGTLQAASSAYTTARKVIDSIRPFPDAPGGPNQRKA